MASIEERTGKRGTSFRVVWRRGDKKHYAKFPDRESAENYATLIEEVNGDRQKADRSLMNLSSTEPHLPTVASAHVDRLIKPSDYTRTRYRQIIQHHFAYLDQPVDTITEDDIARWVRWMMDEGKAPKTIKNSHGLLHAVMTYAVRRGHRTDNPCLHTELPSPDRGDDRDKFLTAQEVAALVPHCHEHYRPHLLFLFASGLRVGELLALTPEDFTVKDGTTWVRVSKALKRDAEGRGMHVGATKTARSRRTLDIDDETMAYVWPLVRAAGHGNQVFRAIRGGELTGHRIRKSMWNPLIRKATEAGFTKRPGMHALRHSHASHLLLSGWSLHDVSRRLGHSNSAITDQVYAHVAPGTERRAAGAMAGAIPPRPNQAEIESVSTGTRTLEPSPAP